MRRAYLAAGLQAQAVWWGRAAVVAVWGLAGTALVGWATGLHQMTRIFGNWPPMVPWTAVLVSALGLAIMVQTGHPSRARVWAGRGVAVAAALVAGMFLFEYMTGQSVGVDSVWFPDVTRALQQTWPGRPSNRTSLAILAVSVAVGLTRVDRRGAATARLTALVGAAAMSVVEIGSYMFSALSVVAVAPSTGIAVATALCVLLLACAAVIERPDRWPLAQLLARPDRLALFQTAAAIAVGPFLIALLHGLLTLRSMGEETAWMVAVLTTFALVGTVLFAISERERRRREEAEMQLDAIVNNAPVAIAVSSLERDYEFANQAFCDFFGVTDPVQIVGRTFDDVIPKLVTSDSVAEVMGKIRIAEAAALRGEIGTFEQEATVNGKQSTFDVQVFPIVGAQGGILSVGVTGFDVTERKRVERELRERLEFEEFISRAIGDGRLVVFAQPIVDARTGQLVEEELLVRMIGPDGELISPDGFLPQAQRFGLMSTIDKFMVASGIELARAGRHVAVNLSASSISDPETVQAITEKLRQAGDAAALMSFEITETTALASMEIAQQFSEDIRSLGCRLALDDFGTGYGSFTELHGLALDTVKIDQSFVRDLPTNERDESVVRMIIGIAREFGLRTTAEGVEDDQTRKRLVELGVDQLQGYLIGAPGPAGVT